MGTIHLKHIICNGEGIKARRPSQKELNYHDHNSTSEGEASVEETWKLVESSDDYSAQKWEWELFSGEIEEVGPEVL
ncbi:hypothetical protein EK904_001450 [Melospiza melodia maxima]|nr:hypothetical protein EK904_001450 [Melospiza melodia maxima]